jgi:hypothetical protein
MISVRRAGHTAAIGLTLLAVAYNLFLEWAAAQTRDHIQSASPIPASDQHLES